MGLTVMGRGRGRGLFVGKGRGVLHGKIQRFPGSPGMYGPPGMRFPRPPCFGPPIFRGPSGSRGVPFAKLPRRQFSGRVQQKNCSKSSETDIDLQLPWITDEIKMEEAKKQELLKTWRNTKDDENWKKYKEQKLIVQTLFDNAKTTYLTNKSKQAVQWWWTAASPKRFYCESCDKSFKSQCLLSIHEVEHEICGREGCQYKAHPKMLFRHRKLQHESGLYKRVGNVVTDEDIEKWIEERKRKYPTRKVIEMKKELEKEKIKRGERISQNYNRFNKNLKKKKIFAKGKKNLNGKKNSYQTQKRRKMFYRENQKSITDALKEESSWRGSIPPFNGIRWLYGSDFKINEKIQNYFSDEEWDTKSQPETDLYAYYNNMKIIKNSLGMLAANYDSDSDFYEPDKTNEDSELPSNKEEDDVGVPKEVNSVSIKKKVDVGNAESESAPKELKTYIEKKVGLDYASASRECKTACFKEEVDVDYKENANVPGESKTICIKKEVEEVDVDYKENANVPGESKTICIKKEIEEVDVDYKENANVPGESKTICIKKEVKEVDVDCAEIASVHKEFETICFGEEINVHNIENKGAFEEIKTVCTKKDDVKRVENHDANCIQRKKKKLRRKKKVASKKASKAKMKQIKERQVTLLEKLLSQEIIHERNVILQCVRYVVENKFFSS